MAAIEIGGKRYSFDESSPIDISIPLRFNGPQPNAFGVDPASAKVLGDTRKGATVNFEEYTFTPHCSGTHTECVGHITNDRISVGGCLKDAFLTAALVSVDVGASPEDKAITADELKAGLSRFDEDKSALIVRTLPNDDSKLSRHYAGDVAPSYFAADAMGLIVECGFKHLLVDLPSVDPIADQGKLIAHRIFWNVAPGEREIDEHTRINSTITELIYVPDEVEDGEYLLNLQIAPFESDAAPSRPILFQSMFEGYL
jgi:arylformamidase